MKKTSSVRSANLNTLKQELQGGDSTSDTYAYEECKYMLFILKNRSVQANNMKEDQFSKIYTKARETLRI